MPGDIETVWDWVYRDWNGQGSCSFFDTKCSHVEPDPNNPDSKEYHSEGDFQAPPGSKTKTLGWGILDKGILCEHGGQTWGRKYNSAICQISGNRERIQKTSWAATNAVLIPRQLGCEVVHSNSE